MTFLWNFFDKIVLNKYIKVHTCMYCHIIQDKVTLYRNWKENVCDFIKFWLFCFARNIGRRTVNDTKLVQVLMRSVCVNVYKVLSLKVGLTMIFLPVHSNCILPLIFKGGLQCCKVLGYFERKTEESLNHLHILVFVLVV